MKKDWNSAALAAAIASGIGIWLCLQVATPWWPWIGLAVFIGTLLGYQPRATAAMIRDWWISEDKTHFEAKENFHELKEGFSNWLEDAWDLKGFLACLGSGWLVGCLLPVYLVITNISPRLQENEDLLLLWALTGAASIVLGGLSFAILPSLLDELPAPYLPISRILVHSASRMPDHPDFPREALGTGNDNPYRDENGKVVSLKGLVAMAILAGIGLILPTISLILFTCLLALKAVDCIVSLAFALTSTARLAAAGGAILGMAAGLWLHLCYGVTTAAIPFGMAVGALSAYGICIMRHKSEVWLSVLLEEV